MPWELEFRELAYLLTAALLVSGLATLLQTLGVWRIGARLPIVQGTSVRGRRLHAFPSWFQTIFESGISAAAVTAVLLNILFNVIGQGRDETPTIFADAPPPGVTPSHDVPGGVDAGVRRDATPPIAADPPPPGVTPSHDVPGGVDSGATETRRERRQPPEH